MANSNFEKIIKQFDYTIPEKLIAQKPASPRENAKLLVFNKRTNNIKLDIFKNLVNYLPEKSVLVFNKTKVIPARLIAVKPSGGKVELLFVKRHKDKLIFLANKKIDISSVIKLDEKNYFTVEEKKENKYFLKPSFSCKKIFNILENYGKTPIPPYIKSSDLDEEELKKEYQAVFAKIKGSVAAPTASLHFTKSLIKEIKKAGHTVCFVTLHVNLGTFATLTEKMFYEKKLHEEYFNIDSKTIDILNNAKAKKNPIIAVGTTVARTLESAVNNEKKLTKNNGSTNLFIDEKYKLKFTDSIITNFHVPKSSLLMLVASFIGRKKLLELYEHAILHNFRFFSFGDGMIILR